MTQSVKPTVLLLPGLMCDAYVWKDQVPALEAAGYAVAAPDMRGPDSLQAMARVALAAAPGPLAIAGHSMGGRVAMECWALEPERIQRLALISTGAYPTRPAERESRLRLARLGLELGMRVVAGAWLAPMLAPSRRGDLALIEPLTAMVMRCTPQQFERQQIAQLNRRDQTPLVASMTVPVDFAAGRHDLHSPPEQHEEMAKLVADARMTVFEDAGHMVGNESPEAVTKFLLGWLER